MEENTSSHSSRHCVTHEAMFSLYEMRKNNLLCDATITLDDGAVLNVHRAIVCSCSEYFRALFTTALNGDKSDVRIPGIRTCIMQKVIDYAYLRKCEITEDIAQELLIISDYFGIQGLMKQCIYYINLKLKPENCIGMYIFARERKCLDLESKARAYTLRHFAQVATKSQEILQLELTDFSNIISDEMLNVKDESTVWQCCLRWIDQESDHRKQHITKLLRGIRLGLLDTKYFMEEVKNHPYVVECEETRPIIIETLTFLYDLDMIETREQEMDTPALALPRYPHEVIFAIGGWSMGHPQTYIETYDTRADRWIQVIEEDPAGPRAYHGTASIGYKIFCIGGFNGRKYFNTCRVFDAFHKTWKEIAPMHCSRCYVSVAALDGLIYALGGYDGCIRQRSAERYDPMTNQWTMIAAMNVQRSDAHACELGGKIYITGGFNGQQCTNTAEYYDPQTDEWTLITNMRSRRSGVACIAHRGLLYVIGGYNGLARINTCERYDPETQTWSSIREMYNPRSNFGIEIIDDMIFAIGGYNGINTISHTECYVVEINEWLEATDMGMVRSGLTANAIMGLPNIEDYIHKNRDRLMEERRLRLLQNQFGY